MANRYILAEDIVSAFKKGHVYGTEGSEVTEISRSENILIVEDKKGERFAVNIKLLIPKQ